IRDRGSQSCICRRFRCSLNTFCHFRNNAHFYINRADQFYEFRQLSEKNKCPRYCNKTTSKEGSGSSYCLCQGSCNKTAKRCGSHYSHGVKTHYSSAFIVIGYCLQYSVACSGLKHHSQSYKNH